MKLFTFAFCLLVSLPISSLQAQKIKKNKDYVVILKTSFGDIHLALYDDTPKHKMNFIKLAQEGFYDQCTFHRVMNNFMIQGGDPESKPGGDERKIGQGGPGYKIPAEIVPHYSHQKGTLAAARQPNRVNPKFESSGSQFYIVHNEKGTPHLDKTYTIFGKVIKGIEVVDKIAEQPIGRANRPLEPIRITAEVKWLKRKKIGKEYGYTPETISEE